MYGGLTGALPIVEPCCSLALTDGSESRAGSHTGTMLSPATTLADTAKRSLLRVRLQSLRTDQLINQSTNQGKLRVSGLFSAEDTEKAVKRVSSFTNGNASWASVSEGGIGSVIRPQWEALVSQLSPVNPPVAMLHGDEHGIELDDSTFAIK